MDYVLKRLKTMLRNERIFRSNAETWIKENEPHPSDSRMKQSDRKAFEESLRQASVNIPQLERAIKILSDNGR